MTTLIFDRLNIIYTLKKNSKRVGRFLRKDKYAVLCLYCQFTFSGFLIIAHFVADAAMTFNKFFHFNRIPQNSLARNITVF